jgi:hypothetical protein
MSLSKYQMFAIVRGKDGAPKVDDPASLHPIQLGMMTKAEREALSVYAGNWGRDAQGFKRVRGTADSGFVADEDMIALSEIFELPDDGTGARLFKIAPRCDIGAGQSLPMDNLQEG